MQLWNTLPASQRSSLIALAGAAATLLAVLLVYSAARETGYRAKCAAVKQNLHAIQLAVERFSVDDPQSYYPRRIEEVISRGYMSEFPLNPFTGQPMHCVPVPDGPPRQFDQLTAPPPGAQPGDFFYFRRYAKDGPQASGGHPTGYSLGAYF